MPLLDQVQSMEARLVRRGSSVLSYPHRLPRPLSSTMRCLLYPVQRQRQRRRKRFVRAHRCCPAYLFCCLPRKRAEMDCTICTQRRRFRRPPLARAIRRSGITSTGNNIAMLCGPRHFPVRAPGREASRRCAQLAQGRKNGLRRCISRPSY